MDIRRRLREFGGATHGALLPFFGVTMAVLFGIVALSFDIGRLGSTQSELQSFADNVALAAAGELDGGADAITRATAAAANLIQDSQTYGNGGTLLSGPADYTLTFLSSLPASDQSGLAGSATTEPAAAAYVHVRATPQTVDLTFGAAFAALTGNEPMDSTVGAEAIAGFTQYACDITPLMFCLPSLDYAANEHIGEMVLMRSGGQGAAWGPGDFGFLDPAYLEVDDEGPCAGLNGAQRDACLISAVGSVTQCFSQRGVDTEPGQKIGIEDASFNVRFDIYKSIMNGKKNDPAYAPAPNVIKGVVPNGGGACIGQNEEVSPDTVGIPRDDCFGAGTCGRFGDGDWAEGRTNYVTVNYAGTDPHPGATTRYEYYLAEIAAAGGAGSSSPILTGLAETGRPQCSSQQSSDPERRVVIAAAVDCGANPINGSATGVPVREFFKLFLTEPVGDDGSSPPNIDIYAEIVGSAGGGSGGGAGAIFHDVVQLYR